MCTCGIRGFARGGDGNSGRATASARAVDGLEEDAGGIDRHKPVEHGHVPMLQWQRLLLAQRLHSELLLRLVCVLECDRALGRRPDRQPLGRAGALLGCVRRDLLRGRTVPGPHGPRDRAPRRCQEVYARRGPLPVDGPTPLPYTACAERIARRVCALADGIKEDIVNATIWSCCCPCCTDGQTQNEIMKQENLNYGCAKVYRATPASNPMERR